jgi:hypothetical protein
MLFSPALFKLFVYIWYTYPQLILKTQRPALGQIWIGAVGQYWIGANSVEHPRGLVPGLLDYLRHRSGFHRGMGDHDHRRDSQDADRMSSLNVSNDLAPEVMAPI